MHHGLDVVDPYRWLEDGESSEVARWVTDQNEHTRQALDARPDRGRWHERLSALVALPTALSCEVRGDRLFVAERPRGADQFVLVLRSAVDADAPARVLVDPAAGVADGAAAIDWFEPNADGTAVAFGLSEGGTENSILHVLDVATGESLVDRIPHARAASVAWQPDGRGFWYSVFPDGDQYHRHIRHHTLGADAADDPVVFDRLPTPESWPDIAVSPTGEYLLVELQVGWSRVDVHLLHLPTNQWRTVIEGIDAHVAFRFHEDRLVGSTTLDAPGGRIVTVPLAEPGHHHWTTVVPERSGVVVERFAMLDDEVVVVASRAAVDVLERWSFPNGAEGELLGTLDDFGVVAVTQLTVDSDTRRLFAVVSSFQTPTSVWRLDHGDLRCWCPDQPSEQALAPLAVSHVSYPSLDGTSIGLFLIHRADVRPSPDVPMILNGYGGFAISESPAWVPNLAAWCAEGGVWAIAGLRGGWEHGQSWHDAGRRANKQTVFDDFHAAGDWLVAQGLASHEQLGLVGGSNGGLLVGAALTQRPDLARAVWCAVPLLDMVRYPQFLIARMWTDEYGDPDIPQEFGWLYAYSPYHQVDDGVMYPAVLFTTAEGDTRVDPLHARKMAALLQQTVRPHEERPVFLLQAGRAGHGVGKPAHMRVAEGVDVLTFLGWQLGWQLGPEGS